MSPVPWTHCSKNQLRAWPYVRSADAFIALTDGRYPLANAKARSMRAELNTHGFVTFF